jgi:hypothetical protein
VQAGLDEARRRRLLEARDAAAGTVIGLEAIEHLGHAKLVEVALRAFGDDARGRFYVETMPPRGRVPRPDLIVLHPRLGCVVIECKGVPLDSIVGVEGTTLRLRRGGGVTLENPFGQAEKVSFRLQDMLRKRLKNGRPIFTCVAALPLIERDAFQKQYAVEWPAETLFAGDFASPDAFETSLLSMSERSRTRSKRKVKWFANGVEELDRILRGKTMFAAGRAVRLEDRGMPADEQRLGLAIERQALEDMLPTRQQHEIGDRDFRGGHWLLRGVAGSGKSVMLAMATAKTLYDLTTLGDDTRPPRVLVCCFNKTLVHFLRGRIEERFGRLSYDTPPVGTLTVKHLHGILSTLEKAEPSLKTGIKMHKRDERAAAMLSRFASLPPERQAALQYDAIFLDEAQDFEPSEFRLLARLCRPDERGRGTLVIFYDNAQNIYGRPLPVWSNLGIEIVGRTTFLNACLRNTRQTLELAFNVLVGSRAAEGERATTRQFADLAGLRQRGLVDESGDMVNVKFSQRGDGPEPRLRLYESRDAETDGIAERVRRLLYDDGVLPSDILILFQSLKRHPRLIEAVRQAAGPNVTVRVVGPEHNANKALPLIEDDVLTMSTVHSAKGYDAAVVIFVGIDAINTTTEDRAAFYVGATRAKHQLILTAGKAEPRRDGKRSLLGEVFAVAEALRSKP